jgi:DNA-binding transcriptional ArsR family regulator
VAADTDIAAVAALIGEPARASMLVSLLDGYPHPARELAAGAGIAASTASEHLSRLLQGGLVVVQVRGRERLYQLRSSTVASAIEVLARIAPPVKVRSLRAALRGEALRAARMCYDHLAGRLGVSVTQALETRGALRAREGSFELSGSGEGVLLDLGVDVDGARARRRAFARPCLDWSERRPHLAGALGAGLADAFLTRGWLRRGPQGRALRITDEGRDSLLSTLGVDPA